MSKCTRCGKRQLFMKLVNGLCPDCIRAVQPLSSPPDEKQGKIKVPFAEADNDVYDEVPLEPSPELKKEREEQALARSEAFSQKLQSAFDRIQWSTIRKIVPGKIEPLSEIEILFLDYLEGHSSKKFKIAGYWVHDYGLNLNKEIQKFFRSGYLQFSDIPFALSKERVPELKAILSAHNLKISGKKAELVQRIIDNVPATDLGDYSQDYLELTESGKQLTSEHAYLLYFFSDPAKSQISIDEASAMHKLHPDLSSPELARMIMYRRLEQHLLSRQWGLYRNTLLSIALTYSIEHDSESGWVLFLQVYILDALGYDNENVQDPTFAFSTPVVVAHIMDYLNEHPSTDLQSAISAAAEMLPVQILPKEAQKVYTRLCNEISETADQ